MSTIIVDCHIYYNVAGFEHNIHIRTGEHAVDVRKLSWQRSWRYSETITEQVFQNMEVYLTEDLNASNDTCMN